MTADTLKPGDRVRDLRYNRMARIIEEYSHVFLIKLDGDDQPIVRDAGQLELLPPDSPADVREAVRGILRNWIHAHSDSYVEEIADALLSDDSRLDIRIRPRPGAEGAR